MDPGLTIVLLGNTGVGKSASGNTILGHSAFESRRSFVPVTKQISSKTEPELFRKQISVIDTPGILGSEREIQTQCQELQQSSRACLFLVVVKIDRFTIEQKTAVDKALKAIGEDGLEKCYLLFTSGDVLSNMSLDEFINEDPEGPLKPVVEKFKGRYHMFNNEDKSQEQVRELLKKAGHLREDLVPPAADSGKKRRIVLLGLPGGGKSSSGNTILGSVQFESDCGFNAVSTETVSKSAQVEGRQVMVVDTPGIPDESLTPKQLFYEIMKSITEARPGPHTFAIVVRLGRITPADIIMFELLKKLFDSEALKYSMVLFTHGDQLKDKSIESLIRANRHVVELVSMCGGRYCVFDNTKTGDRLQVRNLLDKIDEMVTDNGGEHYTNQMNKESQPSLLKILWLRVKEWFIKLLETIKVAMQSESGEMSLGLLSNVSLG